MVPVAKRAFNVFYLDMMWTAGRDHIDITVTAITFTVKLTVTFTVKLTVKRNVYLKAYHNVYRKAYRNVYRNAYCNA